jgi:hypothetical protein
MSSEKPIMKYPKIEAQPLQGDEPLTVGSSPTAGTIQDYWRWAYSDLIDNASRGVFAEWLVAQALGLPTDTPRAVWDNFDLTYEGHGIEVKSCAYHQAWAQKKMSRITFSVRASQGWDPETNLVDKVVKRRADIYVLCLLAEKDRDKLNPLKTEQWRFWVLSTKFLNERKRSQHSIGLSALNKEVGPGVGFEELKAEVDRCINKS